MNSQVFIKIGKMLLLGAVLAPAMALAQVNPASDLVPGNGNTVAVADTTATVTAADSTTVVTKGNRSFFKKIMDAISSEDLDRTHEKAVDMSFVAYPSYSHEPSFGIGGAVTALYRVDRTDSILQPSDAFVSFNASIRGFFQIYGKGNHLLPDGRSRFNYLFELYRMPLDFWGISAEAPLHNPKSKYERYMADIQGNYKFEVIDNLYVGAYLRLNYTATGKIDNIDYLEGEPKHFYVTGVGATFSFDNRDHLLNPTHGFHVTYRPTYYISALSTAKHSFLNQTFIFNYYTPMWRGSVMAFDLYGSFNTGEVPWTMLEMIASDGMRMRGYYMGSYMGKNQIAAQAEYRQHLYKRFGFTLWGGCASLFDSFKSFNRPGQRPPLLPNYGIGLRFEIKKDSNIRLDCGFGRNDFGITFAFGEAF